MEIVKSQQKIKHFLCPDLGEGLTAVIIQRCHIEPGQHILEDQVMFSVETDKVNVEIPAPFAGQVQTIHVTAMQQVKVGDVLVSIKPDTESDSLPHIQDATTPPSSNGRPNNQFNQIPILPIARQLAQQHHIDLAQVKPSNNTYITLDDIQNHIKGHVQQVAPQKKPLDPIRCTLFDDANITNIAESNQKIDFSAIVINAICSTLQQVPEMNTTSAKTEHTDIVPIHLGLATQMDNQLMLPVITDSQYLIHNEIRETINALKQSPSDPRWNQQPPTFIYSNIGSYSGKYGTAMLKASCIAALVSGRCYQQPYFDKGTIINGTFLPLSLTFDHRYVTGKTAASFLNQLIKSLELHKQST